MEQWFWDIEYVSAEEWSLREGNKKEETDIWPFLLPDESFQAVAQEGAQAKPEGSLSWENGIGSLGSTRQLEFTGKIAERERAAHRDLLRSVEGPRWVLSRSASEETTWVRGKKFFLKGRKGATCCAHKGTGIVCTPITSGEKSHNSWWAGQRYSQGYCLSSADYSNPA